MKTFDIMVDRIFWPVWFAGILTRYLWRSGRVTAWAARNADRVYTLLQIAMAFERFSDGRSGWAAVWMWGAFMGLLRWNHPPDDDNRKRRKQAVKEKKEDLSKGWSGMEPVPANG